MKTSTRPSPDRPVAGLDDLDQRRSVEDYFAKFPWKPPPRVVLAQWAVDRFFEAFLRG